MGKKTIERAIARSFRKELVDKLFSKILAKAFLSK